jgi:hypothetical protein
MTLRSVPAANVPQISLPRSAAIRVPVVRLQSRQPIGTGASGPAGFAPSSPVAALHKDMPTFRWRARLDPRVHPSFTDVLGAVPHAYVEQFTEVQTSAPTV